MLSRVRRLEGLCILRPSGLQRIRNHISEELRMELKRTELKAEITKAYSRERLSWFYGMVPEGQVNLLTQRELEFDFDVDADGLQAVYKHVYIPLRHKPLKYEFIGFSVPYLLSCGFPPAFSSNNTALRPLCDAPDLISVHDRRVSADVITKDRDHFLQRGAAGFEWDEAGVPARSLTRSKRNLEGVTDHRLDTSGILDLLWIGHVTEKVVGVSFGSRGRKGLEQAE
ncbi:hypothetical protein B0H13DRAFT_2302681 [Mycena leptocephala]|nr:hypothetical protein B0H13DRAFT_2302681 [Mycena leptocephala]